tara:strand:+ start:2565 stop:3401 length:837 start_codon:yes stop_codon:yes gene_type:complete
VKIKGFSFEIHAPVAESIVLDKIKNDWNYTRGRRDSPDRAKNLPLVAPNRTYRYTTITSPEKYKGKFGAYIGTGFFNDIIVDSGAYTLGGNALDPEKSGETDAIDLRENGMYNALREVRNNSAEEMADSKGVPFLVLLGLTSKAHGYYKSRGYVENSENIPQWVLDKIKDTGKKWYVYNEDDAAMKKAWDILKGKRKISQKGKNYIDEIMLDGKERTSRSLLDDIMNKIDNDNLIRNKQTIRTTYHSVPTTTEIGWYIKSNPIYIRTNNNKPYRYAKE